MMCVILTGGEVTSCIELFMNIKVMVAFIHGQSKHFGEQMGKWRMECRVTLLPLPAARRGWMLCFHQFESREGAGLATFGALALAVLPLRDQRFAFSQAFPRQPRPSSLLRKEN